MAKITNNEKKAELHKQLADDFINILQDDKRNWTKEWASLEAPHNPVSGTKYKNTNHMLLTITAIREGYKDPRWLTFNQIKDKGYKLQKGSKGVPIEFFSYYDRENKQKISPSEYYDLKANGHDVTCFSKFTAVFNGDKIEGLPELEKVENDISSVEVFEKISKNMNVPFKEDGGDRAFYRPMLDEIHMPKKELFFTQYAFESTLAHEFSHSTGAEHRLNREGIAEINTQIKSQYAYEELVAEISAAFFSAKTSFPTNDDIENHKAYVQSWVQAIEKDPNVLINAVKEAESSSAVLEYYGELIPLKEAIAVIGKDSFLEKPENQIVEVVEFSQEKLEAIELVGDNGLELENLSDEFKNDKDIVLKAVKENGYSLEFASEELKLDKEIVLQAVNGNGNAFTFANDELKSDKEFVLLAVKENGYALRFASEELKNDKDVVLEAVKNLNYSIEHASQEIQDIVNDIKSNVNTKIDFEVVELAFICVEIKELAVKHDKVLDLEQIKEFVTEATQFATVQDINEYMDNNVDSLLISIEEMELYKFSEDLAYFKNPELKQVETHEFTQDKNVINIDDIKNNPEAVFEILRGDGSVRQDLTRISEMANLDNELEITLPFLDLQRISEICLNAYYHADNNVSMTNIMDLVAQGFNEEFLDIETLSQINKYDLIELATDNDVERLRTIVEDIRNEAGVVQDVNYLKNAEMSMEQNANNYDGIINNVTEEPKSVKEETSEKPSMFDLIQEKEEIIKSKEATKTEKSQETQK